MMKRIHKKKKDKCKPKKCRQECKKSCPVVRTGCNIKKREIIYDFVSCGSYFRGMYALSLLLTLIRNSWPTFFLPISIV